MGTTVDAGVAGAVGVAAVASAVVGVVAVAGVTCATGVGFAGGTAAGAGDTFFGSGASGGVSDGSWHHASDVAESPIDSVTAAKDGVEIPAARASLSILAS